MGKEDEKRKRSEIEVKLHSWVLSGIGSFLGLLPASQKTQATRASHMKQARTGCFSIPMF